MPETIIDTHPAVLAHRRAIANVVEEYPGASIIQDYAFGPNAWRVYTVEGFQIASGPTPQAAWSRAEAVAVVAKGLRETKQHDTAPKLWEWPKGVMLFCAGSVAAWVIFYFIARCFHYLFLLATHNTQSFVLIAGMVIISGFALWPREGK